MKIISQIKKHLARPLLALALLLGSAKLAAWILSVVAWTVGRAEQRILCLGRTIFVDDIKAMVSYSGRLQYYVIHRHYFEQIFSYFLGNERKEVTEYNYHVSEIGKSGKEKYYQFLFEMLPQLRRALGFSAILSGNFGYVEQQELAKVAETQGVPVIVFHKEGMDVFKDPKLVYKDLRFIGKKMLLYNDRIKNEFLKMRVPGFTEKNSVVVGIPRLDQYFAAANPGNDRRQVVLFSFYPKSYLSFLGAAPANYAEIEKRMNDFHIWAMQYAKANPEVKVVIKTKVPQYYVDYVVSMRDRNFPEVISNLEITSERSSTILIPESYAVMSFNSTTLIEALIAGKIILSPDLRDLVPGNNWNYFEDHPELVNYVHSREELFAILDNPGRKNYADEQKNDFLESLISTPDGQAGKRAESEIINTIANAKTA